MFALFVAFHVSFKLLGTLQSYGGNAKEKSSITFSVHLQYFPNHAACVIW